MERLDELWQDLNKEPNVVITTHRNPDGDAMGSSLAMSLFLQSLGCTTHVIVPDSPPDFLRWLPEAETVVIFDRDPEDAQQLAKEADLIFCLDFNSMSRLANFADAVQASKAKKVLIDHHLDPEDFAHFALSDPTASSTCELVYRFIASLNLLDHLDAEMGSCIYTGLVTDTGSFRYAAVTAETHNVAAHLLSIGVNHTAVHINLFDSNTEQRLRLIGFALAEKLVVLPDLATAYISLSLEEMQKFEFRKGDTEGLVNYALSIEGINLAVFFRESQDGIIKISFRSKGNYDVSKLAREHYHGGGHFNAAGGKSELSLALTLELFEELLQKETADILNA